MARNVSVTHLGATTMLIQQAAIASKPILALIAFLFMIDYSC